MATKKDTVPLGFTCECGKEHKFTAYVHAHWADELIASCECTRRYWVQEGGATLMDRRTDGTIVKAKT